MRTKARSRSTVLGVAFAPVFVLGPCSVASAVPGENGDSSYNVSTGQVSSPFGENSTGNSNGIARLDADVSASALPDLHGVNPQIRQAGKR
jgi:hypothetical protein